MSDDFGKGSAVDIEISSAERALDRGDTRAARRHVARASANGATDSQLERLHVAVAAMERNRLGRARSAVRVGLLVAVLAYAVLATRQPGQWGVSLWAGLAFGAVPIAIGLFVGRRQGNTSATRARFFASLNAVVWPMMAYTLITLLVLRGRIGSPTDSAQLVLAILVVTGVYGLIAGSISGIAGALAFRLGASA